MIASGNVAVLVFALAGAAEAATPSTCGFGAPLPCLPGIDSIGIGYDAVLGRPRPLPVVNVTYAKGQRWSNPFTGAVFAVPDQVTVSGHTEQELTHRVYRTLSSLLQSRSSDAGVDPSVAWFSLSVEVDSSRDMYHSAASVLAESEQLIVAWEATLAPTPVLSATPLLRDAVAALPTAYDDGAYARFVRAFGTHFVRLSSYGGRAMVRTSVAQAFAAERDDEQIQVELQAQWAILGGSGGVHSNVSHSAAWNASGSSGQVLQQGGDPTLTWANGTWAAWAASTFTAPVEIRTELEELADLVADAQKAANLRRAVLEYVGAHNASLHPTVRTEPLSLCGCVEEGFAAGGAVSCSDPNHVWVDAPLDSINLHEGYEFMESSGRCCGFCHSAAPAGPHTRPLRHGEQLGASAPPSRRWSDSADGDDPAGGAGRGGVGTSQAPRVDGLRHVAPALQPQQSLRGPAPRAQTPEAAGASEFPSGLPDLDAGEFGLCNCVQESVVRAATSSGVDNSLSCSQDDAFPVLISLSKLDLHQGYEVMDDPSSVCCRMCIGVPQSTA